MAATWLTEDDAYGQETKLGLRSVTLGELLVPQPASGAKPRGNWSADAKLRARGDAGPDDQLEARCCMTVHDGSLFGVIPATDSARRIWFGYRSPS